MKIPERLKSRKLWVALAVAVIRAIVPILNTELGWGVDVGLLERALNWMSGVSLTYIGVQGAIDYKKESQK